MRKTIILNRDEIAGFIPIRIKGSKLYDLLEEVENYLWQAGEQQVIITIETQ